MFEVYSHTSGWLRRPILQTGAAMLVKAVGNGSDLTGLRVGARDVRRYFPERTPVVELQLGHLRIECALTPDFWRGQPEIRDSRLGLWLRFKNPGASSCRTPIRLEMIPIGENSFRVEPAHRMKVVGAGRAAAPVAGLGLEAVRTGLISEPEPRSFRADRVTNLVACHTGPRQ